jgi:hypothetical protein
MDIGSDRHLTALSGQSHICRKRSTPVPTNQQNSFRRIVVAGSYSKVYGVENDGCQLTGIGFTATRDLMILINPRV